MRNLKDEKTKIYPSTTRGGKELPSSSSLDSPSVMSKLATPKPAPAINFDMSHVIDDATSAMHDTFLGSFAIFRGLCAFPRHYCALFKFNQPVHEMVHKNGLENHARAI